MSKQKVAVAAPSAAVFLLVLLAVVGTTTGHGQKAVTTSKATAFFVFGDSYADTGNLQKVFFVWKPPYGITWPGYPTGRFSNGHVQTDYLADVLGLPSPTPYADSATESIASGVNFALGGSGVTYAQGELPLGSQVDNFELVLRTGAYSPAFLAASVTLVSNVGNDYSSVSYTTKGFVAFIEQVVEGMAVALGRLYELGLRNVLVSNLHPLSCLPEQTIKFNYTACLTSVDSLIVYHNSLLQEAVAKLNKLPSANFIILDEQKAFTYVLNNTAQYGIKEKLVPCCRPVNPEDSCGDVDNQGNPLYTVCDDPTSHIYWDGAHPVESTWRHVVGMFTNETGFVLGAPTLELWLYQSSLRPALAPTPAPSGPVTTGSAATQLDTAYEALISDPDYAESLGLLQAINLDDYLAQYPEQTATIFIPSNDAYFSLPVSTLDKIYGEDEVLPVASYHVVKGYYNSTQLSTSVQNLTTISGLQLTVTPTSTGILVGPEAGMVVSPNLYNVAGQVVIHGIDKILFPPGLQ